MNRRTLSRFCVLALLLAALLVAGGRSSVHAASVSKPAPPAPTQQFSPASQGTDAVIQSCYGSAFHVNRSVTAGFWTGWQYDTTTANCADLNVKVTNHSCSVFVDAQYYKRSEARWVDGAADDFWMNPDVWYTPLTALLDGTQVRVDFYPICSDDLAIFSIAS